jgi:hypothetical protein
METAAACPAGGGGVAHSACVSLLTDVTGTLRLDLHDPRWQQLLRCKRLLFWTGSESEFIHFCERLFHNNKVSGNLHLLFECVSARMYQILHKKLQVTPHSPKHGVTTTEEQTCIGLHLISLFVGYFNAHRTPKEVEYLLELPNNWIPTVTAINGQAHQHMGISQANDSLLHQQQQHNQLLTAITSNGYATTNLILTALKASTAYPSQ